MVKKILFSIIVTGILKITRCSVTALLQEMQAPSASWKRGIPFRNTSYFGHREKILVDSDNLIARLNFQLCDAAGQVNYRVCIRCEKIVNDSLTFGL